MSRSSTIRRKIAGKWQKQPTIKSTLTSNTKHTATFVNSARYSSKATTLTRARPESRFGKPSITANIRRVFLWLQSARLIANDHRRTYCRLPRIENWLHSASKPYTARAATAQRLSRAANCFARVVQDQVFGYTALTVYWPLCGKRHRNWPQKVLETSHPNTSTHAHT